VKARNYGTAEARNLFGGPMLGATMRLGDFGLGAAAYAPFGGQVSFDKNERFSIPCSRTRTMSRSLQAHVMRSSTPGLLQGRTRTCCFSRANNGKRELADPNIGSNTRRVDGGGRYTQCIAILNANVLKTF
jgi:hypothetical protein